MSPRPNSALFLEVPELGPSLGRLTDPPAAGGTGLLGAPLDDIRLRLVTDVFELAGAGRAFAAAGDPTGAVTSLGRVAWLGLWEKAVGAAAERIAATVNVRLDEAAAESRFPPRRLRTLRLGPDDTRAIAARLGSGGAAFVAALDALEQTTRLEGGGMEERGLGEWRSALTAAARRLESAWMALEQAAAVEQRRWQSEIQRVRTWHRPLWPLWLVTLLALGLTGYLGLVVGGYLPVPSGLEGFAAFWWTWL